jgi:histidine triad (HIT) family protein
MSACIFCSIVTGEIPAFRIYEDQDHLAFLDIFPAVLGHTLVIPKKHSADIHEISGTEYGVLASRAKVVAELIQKKLATDGITIMQMNGEAGWQSVFHTHFHIIPRFTSDNLNQLWKPTAASQDELREIHSRIIQNKLSES